MSEIKINQIPREDLGEIKRRLVQQIESMSDAEIEIAARTQRSLAYYIAHAFRAVASLLGYVVALPFAFAISAAKNIWNGFSDGWDEAFRQFGI
jgi:hypothetical protein